MITNSYLDDSYLTAFTGKNPDILNLIKMLLKLPFGKRRCPRCGGNLFIDKKENTVECLQCSKMWEGNK